MSEELLLKWIPIGISFLALFIAGIALGWNIYRDVVLKARVRVAFAVVQIITPGAGAAGGGPSYLRIKATNHGPGPVRIDSIHGMMAPLWRRILRRPQPFVILNDHTNPLNPTLPKRLEVGESVDLFLPHDDKSFLSTDATHIGVVDSFGRSPLLPVGTCGQPAGRMQEILMARSPYVLRTLRG